MSSVQEIIMEWTKETVKDWLKAADANNPAHRAAIGRALLFMYARQTSDEQASGLTSHNNGMGFSGADCEFMSSVASKLQKYGSLSPKQAACVARGLARYSGQLLEFVNQKSMAASA
jgi:hypothetical protein